MTIGSGKVPTFSLSFIQYISLSGSRLSGQIQRGIWNLSSLITLILGENYFSGTIEGLFDNLTQLEYLNLHGNEFDQLGKSSAPAAVVPEQ